jgi:glycosyltransferase involved in cell wall biosynthesis
LPTGVGVCLFIRRALLDDIGCFDAERFGLGYGEENDFCMRALTRGWLHIADDATFIAHAGHRSFGSSSSALQRTAARTLARRHPDYMPAIAAFMKMNPLAPVHERIDRALRARTPVTARRGPRKILHLVHGWPPMQQAGTELYAYWLVQRQLQWREVSVFTRMADVERRQGEPVELADDGARVRLVTNNFVQRNPVARNALRDWTFERAFARFLAEEKPELIHIHHLAGHAFSLAGVAKRFGVPIVQQIQDWWPLCRRVNLFDFEWQRCSGPGIAKCAQCAPMTRIAPAPLWNRVLHRMRRQAARRPLRFGIVGSIIPHKGVHIAAEAFRGIDPSLATLHVWGDTSASPAYVETLRALGGDLLTFEGTFAENAKAAIFDSIDVLLVPSVGLESFGLAAREAMARGVPVVASADGALLEMFEPGLCGELFPPRDADALQSIIVRLAIAPEIVDAWSSRLPKVKSVDAHAEEIEKVYEIVMGSRR